MTLIFKYALLQSNLFHLITIVQLLCGSVPPPPPPSPRHPEKSAFYMYTEHLKTFFKEHLSLHSFHSSLYS